MNSRAAHWLDRFSIFRQLWLLIGSFVVALLVLGGLMTATLRQVQVGGPIYKQVVDGKDLVADILPPPAYLIEAWQVSLELATSTPGAEQRALLAKSDALRKDFETREGYWKDILPEGKLRQTFLDGAYPAGKAFLEVRDAEFIPAIKRQDLAAAQALLPKLKQLYLTHRAKVDAVVVLANARVATDEQTAKDMIASRTLILLGVGIALLAVTVWLGLAIARHVVRSLGGDVKDAAQVVAKVASGDLANDVPLAADDQHSLMFNLQRMQEALRQAEKQAVENARIRRALDSVSSNVRITDANGTVLYANHRLLATVRQLQDGIRRKLPDFDPARFVGMDITRFYDQPESVRQSLQTLRQDRLSVMDIGGRTFEVKTTPVFDDQQQLIGTIGEWHDQTDLLKVQAEVRAVIESARQGDYSQRIDLAGKEGFFEVLSSSMNVLLESTEKALNELADVLSSLAKGDLTVRMQSDFEGMLARLKNDCNQTIDQLAEIVASISTSTQAIHTAAREIASGNMDLSQRTEKQAASIEETAASMEQLTGTVKQNADNARQANELASSASDVASKGGKVVGNVVSTMEDINQSARKIVDIISVIDGIAFQTNILALNAAVEAARAGEQGKGFAVVASEVRGLAQRSAAAAKEIKNLINDSVAKTETGTRLVNEAGETIRDVVVSVQRVTDIMGEISQASVEQSAGIHQVSQTVTQMDDATQQNAALVEEATAAAASLREQAETLQGLVGRFRLSHRQAVVNTPTAAARLVAPRAAPRQRVSVVDDDEWSTF